MSVDRRKWTDLALPVILAAGLPGILMAADVRFNRDVRPVLSYRCFSCHGPDAANRKANLRLDIEREAKSPLKNGKIPVVAGNSAASEVVNRITSESKALRMPPAYLGHQRLNDREIDVIREWIDQGAKYEQHWSFIAPAKASLPTVSKPSWVRNPIDAFVLNRLDRESLTPSPEADRPTLIRRLSLDLTGLPPRPADVDAFVTDQSPEAYERVVDRLLASSQYAERMAIRWMEAARYADTNGYQTDGPRTMWRWRDWVIDAYRHNMPFDQFTIEQLAGDLLPNPTLPQQIATGFNRNHRTSAEGGSINEELRVEYVADRAETTSTVWLGLTVGCARCHDHKFDPISQRDYYSLFAFFNNVPERGFAYDYGNDKPLMMAPLPEQQRKLEELNRAKTATEALWQSKQVRIDALQRKWEKRLAGEKAPSWDITRGLAVQFRGSQRFDGLNVITGDKAPKLDYQDPFTFSAWIMPATATGAVLSHGEDFAESEQHGLYLMNGKLRLHVTHRWTDLAMRLETTQPLNLNRWQHVAITYDGKMEAAGVHIYVNGEVRQIDVIFDQLLAPIKTEAPWRLGAGGGLRFKGAIQDARVYTRALSKDEVGALAVRQDLKDLAAIPAADRTIEQRAKLRLAFLDIAAPSEIREVQKSLATATQALDSFETTVPTTMVMMERAPVRETFVLRRGAYDAHGEKVGAAVPASLPQLPSNARRDRLALAKWLVDRQNPLTARATVNRWWAMLFGTGLVKTVDDFGAQGEWPTHPELLDWLAVDFIESGWRVKHILKTIVMSATYRQSSSVSSTLLQRDPENRLLARASRFRMPAEMIRDSALFTAGLLVDKVGGPPVRPYQPVGLWQELQGGKGYKEDEGEGLYRRSIYTYWRRTIAPPNMMNFDAPTRETCVVREVRTNTPLQALNLMNDVAYVEAARKLGERMLAEGGPSEEGRVRFGIRVVLARDSSQREQQTLSRAVQQFRQYYEKHPKEADALVQQGRSGSDSRLSHSDLAAYTMLGSLLLNLDEAITRE